MIVSFPQGQKYYGTFGKWDFPRYVNGEGPSHIDYSVEETEGVFKKKKHEATYLYDLSKIINSKDPYFNRSSESLIREKQGYYRRTQWQVFMKN